jgi:hypothetical protein
MLRKIFKVILFILLVSSAGLFYAFYHYPEVNSYIHSNIESVLGTAPCQKPIPYSLGSFDERFGITREEFLAAAGEAAAIWGKAINKELFKYSPDGNLKINLIYDYRQEATDKLKDLGFKIDNTKSSYDSLKAAYLSEKSQYEARNKQLESQIADFQAENQKFNSEVEYWNSRGGAPKNIYDSLSAEKERLKSEIDRINSAQNELNKKAAGVNAIIDALNRTAREINANVQTFNKIGQSTGEEFSEGLYISDITGNSISIYQFRNRDQLVRLLAHELGHALGLEHNDNPKSIMYRLNESENLVPTENDIAELKQVCRTTN